MTVRVQLFAVARELAGCGEVAVEVSPPATVADIRTALAASIPALDEILRHSRFAMDAEFVEDDVPVTAQVELALIPPVSGG